MKTKLKLNNATFETSFNGLIMSILMLTCCGGIPFAFIIAYPDTLSRILDNITALLCLIVIIACIFLSFILSVIYYIKGIYKFVKQPFFIKSMTFDMQKVSLIFNDKNLNCNYDYNNVREMRLTLYTINVPNFNTSTYRSGLDLELGVPMSGVIASAPYKGKVMIKEIEVCIVNNKGIRNSIFVSKIQLFDTNMYRLLRDLIFFRQFIPQFSYSFDGPSDNIADRMLYNA